MKRIITLFIQAVLIMSSLFAQDLKELYKRADEFAERYNNKSYYVINSIQAIEGTHNFWYVTNTPAGKEFIILDADQKSSYPAFDQQKLAESLKLVTGKDIGPYELPFSSIRYSKNRDTLYFAVGQINYAGNLKTYEVIKIETMPPVPRYWGTIFKEDRVERVKSPDGQKEAYIVEGNLWVNDLKTGVKTKLSENGSPGEYYSSNIYWSPDSKKIVCCKYRPAEVRKLLLISSSPQDQLQPKTEEYDYLKPGDALPVRKPTAFIVDEKKVIEFDVPDVDMQYNLSRIRWDKDSREFTFDFNKRGHQQYIVYAGNVETGHLRKVVDEQSKTFVYYNNLYQYWFKETGELLWISERDGWRHLYLYDSSDGRVKRQVTKGEWIIKRVVYVDEQKRSAIVVACGRDRGEDPYFEKYYMLNIDSGEMRSLTPENANHRVTFSSDYSYMVDNYSRADLVPTTVIRSVSDGKVIFKPQNQTDISAAVADGWHMPEVFSAKGRDGKTDIWGVIIRPTDFDPNKKYPVIEYIYAGPHDSHVPKSFSITGRTTSLSEIGFITVLIDGMGTANRSKAFHDVSWKNLKDAGFPDRIAWIKAAAAKYPEMDIERMGIFGSSAGGQNSMGALLFHPEFYKVAVSSCGCHDNRMDKIWWNEQWMGYPIGKEYEESSNMVNAHLLQGKLMLILGELDNNVDPASTLQVVDELIKHNKEFEFVMLPGVRHTGGELYGERKRRDFFVRHLSGLSSPEWNIEQ
jgi:Dipeptidyl peptidase IV (DPP IV) N-terminal region./Prolyl oligopeptidase family.